MLKPNGAGYPSEELSGDLEFFEIYTLVDVTNSGVTSIYDSDVVGYNQTQNLNVLLQTVGLRAQPIVSSVRKLEAQTLSGFEFGSDFAPLTEQTLWVVKFATEHHSVWKHNNDSTWHLRVDCDNVAITTGLHETVTFDTGIFVTRDTSQKNTYFKRTEYL